ncbi:MAG: glycosyltransferase family 4 protein [Terracidiphilus sp.]|jgi:glycosyltransferase involved in cell wall biosynthesis
MRICIVAENASTRFGGEAILPVHYFGLLRSRGIECWMVVHSRTRSELVEMFPRDIDRIFFVPDLWIHKLLHSLSRYLPKRLSESTLGLSNQLITQFCQRAIVRKLIRDQRVDLIHQPIPVAPRFPSLIFGLGAPVVIGPLNGGMEYPPAFRRNESWMSRVLLAFVRLFTNMGNALFPGKKHADVVLVANERTRRALPSGIRGKVIELVENGIDIGLWQNASNSSDSKVPRFIFLGRLVDWKAVDVVIRALEKLSSAELEIIGDGPMLEVWRSLADGLGLKDRVHFVGWLPQQECAARLKGSLALLLPSLYECGGAVVLEAMAMGKPVIATKWGGPADYLDDSCGVLIEPQSYSGLVTGFAEAMQKMIDFPELRKSMGAAGREKALRDFDWQQKMDHVIRIYHMVTEKSDISHEFMENEISSPSVS